jgi:general secretion pathway protein K
MRPNNRPRGAALLMALIIVTLVSTLAAAMVWQQWRSVQVESAERARAQSVWILTGALEWAQVILKEDAKGSAFDHLGEVWATPLAEARMSTFLAADENNTDDAPETFLSGSITDAQAKYNLRNLINEKGEIVPAEKEVLERLCLNANIAPTVATSIAKGLQLALAPTVSPPPKEANLDNAPLMPERTDQLSWLNIEPDALKRLEPYIVLLPTATSVNINTAPREVIAAVFPKLDLGSAQRLMQIRDRKPFETPQSVQTHLPQGTDLPPPSRINTTSRYFFVRGKVRLENQVLEQRSLVLRQGTQVRALTREWVSGHEAAKPV